MFLQLFRRLSSESMTDLVEMQLLSMKSYLLKLNKYKSVEVKRECDGKILLDRRPDICHEYVMIDKNHSPDSRSRSNKSDETSNSDWHHMYTLDQQSAMTSSPSGESGNGGGTGGGNGGGSTTGCAGSAVSSTTHIPSSSLVEYSMPEKSFVQGKTALYT